MHVNNGANEWSFVPLSVSAVIVFIVVGWYSPSELML